jgi:FkbM family methyltransferase
VTALRQPVGSKVSPEELLREVDEYFELGAFVAPGDTVVDVGANVGAFSLRVAERCEGNVRLLCFEPSPDTCTALRANFADHPMLAKTQHAIHPVGLTSRDHAGKELSFYNFRRYPTNSTFDLASKRREFEIFFEDRGQRAYDKLRTTLPTLGRAIRAVVSWLPKGSVGWWGARQIMGLEEVKARLETLDDVVARDGLTRIDLLKIDVEGPELDVLRGIGADTWPLVKQVVMETHDRDGRLAEIESILRANGLVDIRSIRQTTIDNGLESILLLASRRLAAGSPPPV